MASTRGAVDSLLPLALSFPCGQSTAPELTDPAFLAYFLPGFLGAFGLGLGAGFVPLLAWQSLTALLQSALHWLRRLLQYST
jgi:hypothetical protein